MLYLRVACRGIGTNYVRGMMYHNWDVIKDGMIEQHFPHHTSSCSLLLAYICCSCYTSYAV